MLLKTLITFVFQIDPNVKYGYYFRVEFLNDKTYVLCKYINKFLTINMLPRLLLGWASDCGI